MVKVQSSEYVFSVWVWETISKLKLHKLEQSDTECQFSMSNQSHAFSQVPDVDSDPSLDILISGTREKQPVACYVAIRMTLYGHSVPLICSKSFDLIQILQNYYKYDQVLIILSNIVPLFIESPESLLKYEKFINIINSCIIVADRTCMKIAKN